MFNMYLNIAASVSVGLLVAIVAAFFLRRMPTNDGWIWATPAVRTKPRRGTPQSVGIDIYPLHHYNLKAHTTTMVETGIIVKPPKGHFTMLVERSSLHKMGLNLANNVGIIDPDYCGKGDTIKVALHNFCKYDCVVGPDRAIAQLIFVPYYIHNTKTGMPPDGVPDLTSRGGFGSTNVK